jgi:hypothetical protein
MSGKNSQVLEITRILRAVGNGDLKPSEELFPALHDRLRRIAAAMLAKEAAGPTPQATARVDVAWLRLEVSDQPDYPERP